MPRGSSQIRRNLLVFGYVTGIALIMLLLPARFTAPARVVFTEAVAPAQGVVFRAAGDALATTGTLRDAFLARERERLQARRIEQLQSREERLRELILDRQRRLQSYERLDVQDFSFRALSSRVSAYDSTSMRRSIVIGAGSSDGVREGHAVTARGALIGTVREAGPWHSRVQLLTDGESRIPCRVQRTRDLCVLEGTGSALCSVEWVGRTSKVRAGDVLVSAPVEAALSEPPVLPAGVPAATIVQVRPGRTRPLFQEVTARPRVDTSRLEAVEVIIPRGRAAGGDEED